MSASEQTPITRMHRALLLLVCVPMVLAYGFLSLLIVFPLVSLLAGNLIQGVFVLWWLLGTLGLLVLVYSSATFDGAARPLLPWQVLGLVAGMLASVPLVLGFFGGWWFPVCAIPAACVSGYILLSSRLRPPGGEAK